MDPAYRGLQWKAQRPSLRAWLSAHPEAIPVPYLQAREAEILTLGEAPRFALKVWTDTDADPEREYDLMQQAEALGLPVAEPVGWGTDEAGRPFLATRFEGQNLGVVSPEGARDLARLLRQVHRTPLPALGIAAPDRPLQALVARHTAEAAAHPDLLALLDTARRRLPDRPAGFIHGDFHAGNVVERSDALHLLDWGEAGAGDQRYDLAWAGLLLWIYSGEAAYRAFLEEYAAAGGSLEGLDDAELIAAARWLYLARTAPVPINGEWIEAVRRFLTTRLPAGRSVAEMDGRE